jgi:hypothetical protein
VLQAIPSKLVCTFSGMMTSAGLVDSISELA